MNTLNKVADAMANSVSENKVAGSNKNNELEKDEQGNWINPYFNNPDYIESDEEESYKSHGLRIHSMIEKKNVFVHGLDKACNAHKSVLIILSECEGMEYPDANAVCVGYSGLTLRTVQEKVRAFKAIKVLAQESIVEFIPPYQRKRL